MARAVCFCRALGLAVLVLCIAAPAVSYAGQDRISVQQGSSATTEPWPGGVLFIENVGQFDDAARFQIWSGGDATWLAQDAEWFTVAEPQATDVVPESVGSVGTDAENTPAAIVGLRVSFVDANPTPEMEPFGAVDTHVSYFIGADAGDWHADVPVWSGVRYVDLYPGIDLEVTSENGRMVQRVVATSEAGVQTLPTIQMRIEGADSLTLDGDAVRAETILGDVIVPLLQGDQASREAGVSTIGSDVHRMPTVHGDVVDSPYAVTTAATIQNQPPDRPQDMRYGIAFDERSWAYGIACDEAGAAYSVGTSSSSDLPEWSAPGYDQDNNGSDDIVVLKLNADATLLEYATFVGGNATDSGEDIVVNAAGEVYITGWSDSGDFPCIEGIGYDCTDNGLSDAFVVKLSANGCSLLYSTLIGGSKHDRAQGIALDDDGAVYVSGYTESRDFPAVSGPGYCSTYGGGTHDAFVIKMSSDGSALSYATYIGGSADDSGADIAIDDSGDAYVTGYTKSADFAATVGPGYDLAYGGVSDAYVVKLSPDGQSLSYATFLGGNDADEGLGIAVDRDGAAYVTGYTRSSDFTATAGPGFDISHNGGTDAFVVKMSDDGLGLSYSTFLGGVKSDTGYDIAVTAAGSAYVVGYTSSPDFPAVMGPGFDTSLRGSGFSMDVFVIRLARDGRSLPYATFIGGDGDDWGQAIAVDVYGAMYITGDATSRDFPAVGAPGHELYCSNGYFMICLAYDTASSPRLYLPAVSKRD